MLRALQRFKIGDVAAAADAARKAIRLDLGDSHPGRSAAYCVYGATLYWSGSPHEAWAAFSRAVQLAARSLQTTRQHLERSSCPSGAEGTWKWRPPS